MKLNINKSDSLKYKFTMSATPNRRSCVKGSPWIDLKDCPHTSGIVVSFYYAPKDTPKYMPVSDVQTITCEDLCMKACKHIGIGSVGYYLCGLLPVSQTARNSIFLPPGYVITMNGSARLNFVLRIIFFPPPEDKKMKKLKEYDPIALQYFYYQCFDDFRNDRFVVNDVQRDVLGVALLDNLLYDRVHPAVEKQNATYFIPRSYQAKSFDRFYNKWRLNSQFTKKLNDVKTTYEEYDIATLQILNLVSGLFKLVKNYGQEFFEAAAGSDVDSVSVEPYGTKCGLVLTSQIVSEFFPMEDLMDLVVKDCEVMIHRKSGPPRRILFDGHLSALSFITCVDGYYRLSIEFYNQLCSSPELVGRRAAMMRKVRCHGPIKLRLAQRALRNARDRDVDLPFILLENQKVLGAFQLLFYRGNDQALCDIQQDDADGRFRVLPVAEGDAGFSSLVELLSFHRTNDAGSFKLKSAIRPSDNAIDSDIYLCRPASTDKNAEENDSAIKVPQIVKAVSAEISRGQSQFTEVCEGSWSDGRVGGSSRGAIKQLKPAGMQHVKEFLGGIQAAAFWNSEHIVRIYGMLVSPPSLVMEYAPYGDLATHLRIFHSRLHPGKLCHIAQQVALAVYYLQSEQLVHGNIRTRNVLVFSTDFDIRVKLADPGLVWDAMDANTFNEKLPWLAPELYDNHSARTTRSDLFALGSTLYEIFNKGVRPFADLSGTEIKEAISKELPACPDLCPEVIFHCFRWCWSLFSDERPSAKDIVRQIRIFEMDEGPAMSIGSSMSASSSALRQSVNQPPLHSDASRVSVLSERTMTKQNEANQQAAAGAATEGGEGQQQSSPSSGSVISSAGAATVAPWVGSGDSETPLLDGLHLPTFGSQGNTLSTAGGESGATLSTLLSHVNSGDFAGIRNAGSAFSFELSGPTGIDRNNLVLENQKQSLGEGYYGAVYKGMLTTSRQIVAVKSLHFGSTTEAEREQLIRDFKQEINLMKDLQHPNIVQILGQCENYTSDLPLLLVMEFVEKGSLYSYLTSNRKTLDTSETARSQLVHIGCDIAEGMKYLHSRNIIHRDLATRNVLVTKDIRAKIGDFGLSRLLNVENVYKGSQMKAIPAPWCALESLVSRHFTKETDVWMYGVTLWEVFSLAQSPKLCTDLNQLSTVLSKGDRLGQPRLAPDEVYNLMMKCWFRDKTRRPTFVDICHSMRSFQHQLQN